MISTYSSADIVATWGPIDLSKGLGQDVFLTIEPIEDRINVQWSADGQMAPSKTANKGATITMVFMQNAPVNNDLAIQVAIADTIGADIPLFPFVVVDEKGGSVNFIALNALLTSVASTSYGVNMQERTYVWTCESYLIGGSPISLAASLSQYLPF